MGLFKNIFGISEVNEDKTEIKSWVIEMLLEVEKVSDALCIYNCTVQVAYENTLQIRIQDWHDDMIMKHGKEFGLEKYFNLKPVEGYSGIYISVLRPHVSGNAKGVIKKVMEEIEMQYHFGYEYDSEFGTFVKNFR